MNLKAMNEIADLYDCHNVIEVDRTGSNYTCEPPVNDTDIDLLVLVQDIAHLTPLLVRGYKVTDSTTPEGKELYEEDTEYGETWWALRRGEFNLIVTDQPAWYARMQQATHVCKEHNVRDKADRIAIFRWVRDGLDEEAHDAALARWPQ